MPPEYRWFFDLRREQQHAEMKKFALDKQVDYYLVGMTYVHPPRMGLADDIAMQGKNAVPYLIARLRNEKEDYKRAHLIYVFTTMSLLHYDLRDDKEVIRVLTETVATMKDPWKQRSQNNLKEILDGQVGDPEKALEEMKDALQGSK